MDKTSVLVGMSGGVDSSAAALLLQRQGFRVAGATFLLWNGADGRCGTEREAADAAEVCRILGIPHHIIDLRERFEAAVIRRFAESYRQGRTPNPCVDCNRSIKFPGLLEAADRLGYARIATGHYARILRDGEGRAHLAAAADRRKDQSYMLWALPKRALERVELPLWPYEKDAVRALAREAGLPVYDKAESQDVCFIPDGDMPGFLERYAGLTPAPGDFLDGDGAVIGRHDGCWKYTIGQRRGLGVGFGQRMFVTGIDPAHNTVTLSAGEGLFRRRLIAGELNLLEGELTGPAAVTAKIRYAARPAAATLYPLEGSRALVEFGEGQRAVTPGQAVVFYQGEILWGGGIILPELPPED